MYPVVLVQPCNDDCASRCAESAVREVVHAYEHETDSIYYVYVIVINSPQSRTFEAPVAPAQPPLQENTVEGTAKVWNKVHDPVGLKAVRTFINKYSALTTTGPDAACEDAYHCGKAVTPLNFPAYQCRYSPSHPAF